MIHDGRLYIDNTIIKSVSGCSLQAVLRHVLHWNSREESVHLRAGTAMHEAQAVWNRELVRREHPDLARERAMQKFAAEYKTYADLWVPLDTPLARLAYDNLATILDEWFATRVGKLPWYVPDERLIEVGFAYPLDAEGRIIGFGRFDLIARDNKDFSLIVIDHKSTGRIDLAWTDSWALDPQVTHYTWGSLQHVPDVKGFYVNGIEFSKLPSSDKKCREHGLPYNECARAHMKAQILGPVKRSPELLLRWQLDALRAAEKFRWYAENYDPNLVGTTPDLSNVEMEGPFTNTCRFCTFKDWCRTGRNENSLPVMFEQDEWHPFDPREFEGKESPVKEVLEG